MTLQKLSLLLFSLILAPGLTFSQSTPDSTFRVTAESLAVDSYLNSVKHQELVFGGIEYFPFSGQSRQFPYYGSEYSEVGEVTFNNQLYRDVPLYYDLVADKLVAEHYDQSGLLTYIILRQDRIQSFTILGRRFVRITNEPTGTLQDGFHGLLYDGDVRLYAKYKKTKRDEYVSNTVRTAFDEKVSYYVYKDNKFYPVKSKSGLLKLLPDEKKALKEFSSRYRLDFSKPSRENSLTQLVAQYDKLKNAQ